MVSCVADPFSPLCIAFSPRESLTVAIASSLIVETVLRCVFAPHRAPRYVLCRTRLLPGQTALQTEPRTAVSAESGEPAAARRHPASPPALSAVAARPSQP